MPQCLPREIEFQSLVLRCVFPNTLYVKSVLGWIGEGRDEKKAQEHLSSCGAHRLSKCGPKESPVKTLGAQRRIIAKEASGCRVGKPGHYNVSIFLYTGVGRNSENSLAPAL